MDDEKRTILISGSTDGVGRHVAERLASPNVLVLVHGRDSVRGAAVVDAIARKGGSAHFYRADLASLSEVRDLANSLRNDHSHIDAVINNAGIAHVRNDERRLSADGYELHFAVNYLAGFLLTNLLLPSLGRRRPSRIVNVVSLGQQPIDFEDVMLEKGYTAWRAYCQSKLAQVMFTFDLAHAFSGVTANCLHPASLMDTPLVRAAGLVPATTVEEGGNAILALATSPKMTGRTGLYFDGQREERANEQAYDAAARQRLRELSARLTDLGDAAEATLDRV